MHAAFMKRQPEEMMAEPKRRSRRASAPESLIKKADDRHPYGGRPAKPLENVDIDVGDRRPRPSMKRRPPQPDFEEPYTEPREKNRRRSK